MIARRRLARSLRFRITTAAVAVVIIVLVPTSAVVLRSVKRHLLQQVDHGLVNSATYVIEQLRDRRALSPDAPAGTFGEVVQTNGVVLGASTNLDGLPPLVEVKPVGTRPLLFTTRHPRLGELRILEQRLGPGSAPILVEAQQITQVSNAVHSLSVLVIIFGPLLSVAVGAIVWLVVGRAMRPVEAIRVAASEISDSGLNERLPSPETGDELERLVETMNQMLGRLHAALDRERRFVADASHELRGPIAGVRALLEAQGTDGDQVEDANRRALSALHRLQDLAEQLLILDTARPPDPSRPVDLDDLVLSQVGELRTTTGLEIDASGVSGGQVLGSEVDMTRIIENLASNAARHARTRIAFSVAEAQNCVELTITDDGPGVPEDKRQVIFDRFARLDSDRSRTVGGAGLGLAIVRDIVAKYGGHVRVEDAPGAGARFVVSLPASVRTELLNES